MTLRPLVIIVMALATLACAPAARAQSVPTYYVHSGIVGSDAGGLTGPDTRITVGESDGNPGTDPSAPLRSLGVLGLQSKAPPFVAYVAGRFYTPDSSPYAFYKVSANGVEIRQWPGQVQAQIKMSNRIGPGWTALGGGAFSKLCASSPDLRG